MRSFWSLLNECHVVIPILQRDYAQGRSTARVKVIRENLLNSLCGAIRDAREPLVLDFVYGYTRQQDEMQVFYPLDGQQRLTTLYLLHWYLAAREGRLTVAAETLTRFTYEVRHSSRVFCKQLVSFCPDQFDKPVKDTIINQPWFFTAWINDPTIQAMLTMLNAIQQKAAAFDLPPVWDQLTSDCSPIVFHQLSMENLGLPDDLYIKMNARGKELTDFEYFKVRFSEILDRQQAQAFNQKIDQVWSDLFWDLYKDSPLADIAQAVDAGIMRFFSYMTDLIIARNNLDKLNGEDILTRYRILYRDPDHAAFLFGTLDLFCSMKQNRPDFFQSIFSTDRDAWIDNKVRLFFIDALPDLLKKCADKYDPKLRNNPFSIGEQLLLYACILHLKGQTEHFSARIRKLRNLIAASEDNLRGEFLPSLVQSVQELIVDGTLSVENRFAKTQLQNEADKAEFLDRYPEQADAIRCLEDHELLRGSLDVITLQADMAAVADQFDRVFTPDCDYDTISCALFTFGDYVQSSSYNTLLGSRKTSSWRDLFTPTQRRDRFTITKTVLSKLLNYLQANPAVDLSTIINNYLMAVQEDTPRDWRYYFIRYETFRRHEGGYYYWQNRSKPYECRMLQRKTADGKNWDPFLFSIKALSSYPVSLEQYGAPLIFVKGDATLKIQNRNSGYILEPVDEAGRLLFDAACQSGLITPEGDCPIRQTPDGIDLDDRVQIGVELIEIISALAIQ